MPLLIVALFGPAILMGLAIFAIPRGWLLLRRKVVVSLILLFLVGFVVVILTTDHSRDILGPPFFTAIVGFLMQSSLHESRKIHWWRIALSLMLSVLACFALGHVASFGGWAPAFAFFVALSATGIAIVAGLWMVWSLPRWRKLAALVVGVVLPVTFLASISIGETRSPETVTEKNGDRIVQALEQYHLETGTYPTELTGLAPVYLAALPEALTTQGTGWLYTSNDKQYTLGYWHDPDRDGATLCLHSSESKNWECEFTFMPRGWGPFQGVPTPTPCRNDKGQWVDTGNCK